MLQMLKQHRKSITLPFCAEPARLMVVWLLIAMRSWLAVLVDVKIYLQSDG